MPQHLAWLFGRAGIPVMNANNGEGNDLPGASTAADATESDQAAKAAGEGEGEGAGADEDETKGKSVLSDAEAKLLRDVMKHKSRSKELEDKLNALTGVLGDLKPEDVASIIQERKENERKELEKRGEYERILEQVKTEHTREKQTLAEQVDALKQALNEKDGAIQEMTVGRAFAESEFIREKSRIPASIARKEFGPYVDMIDGIVVVHDKPKGAADRTPLVDGQGNYKHFDEAIVQLYSSHPDAKELIKAQAKPGAASGTEDLGVKPGKQPGEVATGVNRIAHALGKKNQ